MLARDADEALDGGRLAPARARAIAVALRTGAPCSAEDAASLLDHLECEAVRRARRVVALLSRGEYNEARVLLDTDTLAQL
jgi:hypothetical protein